MSESQIQTKILLYLNEIGAYCVKTIATNRKGSLDILCCLNGLFVAFEVKSKKGVTSPLQKYHIKQIKNSGGISAIVRSVADVKEVLTREGLCKN